jgi:hypothetical protein
VLDVAQRSVFDGIDIVLTISMNASRICARARGLRICAGSPEPRRSDGQEILFETGKPDFGRPRRYHPACTLQR